MIKHGMKVGERFTDGGLTYEVLEVVPEGYVSRMVDDFPMSSPIEVLPTEEKASEKLTKTAIKRMSKEKLIALCEEKGIEATEVEEMRKKLIELL